MMATFLTGSIIVTFIESHWLDINILIIIAFWHKTSESRLSLFNELHIPYFLYTYTPTIHSRPQNIVATKRLIYYVKLLKTLKVSCS